MPLQKYSARAISTLFPRARKWRATYLDHQLCELAESHAIGTSLFSLFLFPSGPLRKLPPVTDAGKQKEEEETREQLESAKAEYEKAKEEYRRERARRHAERERQREAKERETK